METVLKKIEDLHAQGKLDDVVYKADHSHLAPALQSEGAKLLETRDKMENILENLLKK